MITDLDTDLHHIFYRNDPPGKSISFATEELLRLCEKHPLGLPMTDLSTKDLTIHEQRTRQKFLQSEIQRCRCVMCPNFDNHVSFYRDSSFFWPGYPLCFLIVSACPYETPSLLVKKLQQTWQFNQAATSLLKLPVICRLVTTC